MSRYHVSLVVVLLLTGAPQAALAAQGCQFQLGFAALEKLIPIQVGACLEDENHNPVNGDGLQHTQGGLMVWRKADNWTAFTDGYHTWINGPYGLQSRLNNQLFAWEKAEQAQAAATTLLDTAGQGEGDAGAINPRGNFDVAYQFACDDQSPFFRIEADLPNNGGYDQSTDQFHGATGRGLAHFTVSGPHVLHIATQTDCSWHVTVTG